MGGGLEAFPGVRNRSWFSGDRQHGNCEELCRQGTVEFSCTKMLGHRREEQGVGGKELWADGIFSKVAETECASREGPV